MGDTPEFVDAAIDTGRGIAPPPPPSEPAGARDRWVPARVQTALAAVTSRRALGLVLVVGWVIWLAAVWVSQPRLVPQDLLTDELGSGYATSYQVVTVQVDRAAGPFSGPYRIDVTPVAETRDAAVNTDTDTDTDTAVDGRPTTIAYWVDSPVADLRVLDPNGLSSDTPAALAAAFRAAGVPEADTSGLHRGTPASRVDDAGALLLFFTTLVVVLGPRPRRGTRWFWFWLVGGPLAVGVPIFAVAELLRPRYEPEGTVHPSGAAGRWNGLTGFALGFVVALAGAAVLLALSDLSPTWFIRG